MTEKKPAEWPLAAMVVPVHNSWEHTREFLDSVRKTDYPNYVVIVVDDGSTDGTGDAIKAGYPEVVLLTGDGSLWSSGAVNLGIQKALELGAGYVLQIDNDTVVDPGFLTALVETAQANPGSIIIPKVLQYDQPDRIDKAGYERRWLGMFYYPRGHGELDLGQYDTPQDLLWADTMMLIDAAVIRDIGLMDTRHFPMYGADSDYTIRARRHGHRIIFEPKSRLWHKGHISARTTAPRLTSRRERWRYLTGDRRSILQWQTNSNAIRRHAAWYRKPVLLLLYARDLCVQMLRRD